MLQKMKNMMEEKNSGDIDAEALAIEHTLYVIFTYPSV